MFYCDECAKLRFWPEKTLVRSYGACELCRKAADCNDVPSGQLPRRNFNDDEGDQRVEVNDWFRQQLGD